MVKVNVLVMAAIIIFSHVWLFSVFDHAAGKGKDVRKRPSTRASGSSGDDPALNSISVWQKQSLEVLKLACEHLVSSGSCSALARRLYDHYHRPAPQQSDPLPPSSNLIDHATLPPPATLPPSNTLPPPTTSNSEGFVQSDFQNILCEEFQKFYKLHAIIALAHPTMDFSSK